jgi:diguanylate cyclase (GGDEF)-like protein
MQGMTAPRHSAALRLARKAWRIQYLDSQGSHALAEQALARAAPDDVAARAWARLARGYHRMRHAAPVEASAELEQARAAFEALGDRRGEILATVGGARCRWLEGRFRESLAIVLPLRAQGLALLAHEERGILLNTIAGCHSALGDSAQAFAYMYQALRESRPAREHGFHIVLYCNLAHELYLLGDCDGALSHLHAGLERSARLNNPRLTAVLRGNRVVCLTDLGRPGEALPDIRAVLALPADATRGVGWETMALAALRAGDAALGEQLLGRARAMPEHERMPDARIELAVAEAQREATPDAAMARLERALPLPAEGVSLRAQCLLFQALADAHERAGRAGDALAAMRRWQALHVERARLASQARYQAASLQTELLRLQHERDEIEARRRASEQARAELEAVNRRLARTVQEVQSLTAELEQRALRDALTGLHNRRHFNEVLPTLHALAQRPLAAGRAPQPLALAVIDLDHFKAVNDRHGHLAGDAVLQAFGRLLARRLRKSDVACRYGGEEFCLLMPRTDAANARRKVEALLREWRAMRFEFETGTLEGPTFSAGIADTGAAPGTAQRLVGVADDCALEAKRRGRGRTVVFDGAALRERGAPSMTPG